MCVSSRALRPSIRPLSASILPPRSAGERVDPSIQPRTLGVDPVAQRVDPSAEVRGERVHPTIKPGALGIDAIAEGVDPTAQVEDARDQRCGEDADRGPGDSHQTNLAPATDIRVARLLPPRLGSRDRDRWA
jgi:hypothetical protein